ncbi:prepilin-type N-terminal cleavage/methylation domain-containing protein [Nodosilinea sp. LEGE 07088]|uniref:type IV pilin protein n=1 Tax=Nodosilinea sp. LEGE 07088 TaxID=2777968 RepID=UPI00187FA476|nr:type IV pilin-like G/H family protein [Nodosilinea sp. LEGE 07088]MBE9137541.1 prepilin-type N-terminal cleavage/methylation domain-containing protein [Nodosilinea sp. LEGE 07088]
MAMANYLRRFHVKLCSSAKGSQEKGFTLVELLVVIITTSILAAIALPSFLNQAARAKQAGALKYIGAVNRGQQIFFLENSRFATSINELGFLAAQAPDDYSYTLTSGIGGLTVASAQAIPTDPVLRGYAGVVFATLDSGGGPKLATVICQGVAATAPTPTPVMVGSEMQITNCDYL